MYGNFMDLGTLLNKAKNNGPAVGNGVLLYSAVASDVSALKDDVVLELIPNAAIIIKVNDTSVDLFVILQRAEILFLHNVPYSQNPAHAHWSWPEARSTN